MLKKSHAGSLAPMSIVGILLAVLFVFAGCEGPAGPTGLQGDDGSDVPFPGEITVTIPGGNNVPSLPAGVTYPPLTGAKILSGSAADISKAFNGGILVANTPDSGEFDPAQSGTNEGTVYAQDAVDYVVWTGIGNPALAQGSIVVPPGKTLFIAAPLPVNAGVGYFQGITVSDTGTFSPAGIASVQAATAGGTTIDSINEGKIVLLNGGRIDGTTGPITIGGTLEIHHGASIVVGGTTFLTTAKSTTNVYGNIIGGTEVLTFDGDLTIKGGGLVSGSTGDDGYGNSDTYGPYGTVIVESYGALRLGNPVTANARVNFYGPVTVQENASLSLYTYLGASDNPVTFHRLADISGLLTIGGNLVTADSVAGHLKINATGGISASGWDRIGTGIPGDASDVSLLAAIAPNAVRSAANKYTTIAVPDTGLVTLEFAGEISATTYANLRDLAASTVLDLPGGITASAPGVNDVLLFGPSDPTLNVTTNNVVLAAGYTSIGNVFVAKGKELTINTDIKSAGEITIYGDFFAAGATFDTKLDKLTIGAASTSSDPAVVADVELDTANFAAASPEIVVNQGSTLSLGGTAVNVNPAGSISLGANAKLTIAGTYSTLARLKTLSIAEGAVFNSTDSTITTFEELEFLTVNGELNASVVGIPSSGPAPITAVDDIFRYLQEHVVDTRTGDVIGSGKAVFTGWAVGAADAHAFDQLLGIKDLTVLSVTGIPKTSGNEAGWTADANKPPAGTEGIILRATAVNVPEDGFTVDRDLHLIGTLTFFGADNTVAINQGAKIVTGLLAGPGLMSGSTSAPVILVSGGATTLAAATGTLTVGISTLAVQLGTILKVDGELISGLSGAEILAGEGTDYRIELVSNALPLNPTSLKNGLIASKGSPGDSDVGATITVNATGTLTVSEPSTVGETSSVTIIPGGKIVASDTLTFGDGTALVIDDGSLTSSRSDTTITATSDVLTTITGGDLILTGGGDVLAVTTGTLAINSSVIIRGSGTSYDSLSIGGVSLVGAVFDATVGAPVLTLTGTLTGGTSGGSLTTKNNGVLEIGTIATLKATNGQPLTNNVVLNGTAGLTAGTLGLVNYAVLNILGTFGVGNGSWGGPAGVATLDVSASGSKITFGGGFSIVLEDVAGTQISGALKISSNLSLLGSAAANTAAAWGAGLAGATTTAGAMGINDIYANAGNAAHDATAGVGSTASVASGVVTITGVLNNTITATTKVGLGNT